MNQFDNEKAQFTWALVIIPLIATVPAYLLVWIMLAFSYDAPGSENNPFTKIIGLLLLTGIILFPVLASLAIYSKRKGRKKAALLFANANWAWPLLVLIFRFVT